MFIRYLDIPSDKYQTLINAAAEFAVDLNSEAYEAMYIRLNEWGKNWFSLYAQAATVLQNELEVAQHWGGLGKGELVSAYSGVYTPEHTITLFRGVHAPCCLFPFLLPHLVTFTPRCPVTSRNSRPPCDRNCRVNATVSPVRQTHRSSAAIVTPEQASQSL